MAVSFSIFVYILWQNFAKGSCPRGILINQGPVFICPEYGNPLFLETGQNLGMGVAISISLSYGYQDGLWLQLIEECP